MSKHTALATGEHLDSILAGAGPASDPLAMLVRAAQAPGSTAELAGAETALAMFLAASAEPAVVAEPGRKPILGPVLRRALAAKMFIFGLGAATLSGVALAAASGHLPTVFPHSHPAAPSGHPHTPGSSISAGYPGSTSYPNGSDHPTGPPSVIPSTTHPTGPPSVIPSASHPTGPPTAIPSTAHKSGPPSVIPSTAHKSGPPSVIPSKTHPVR